MLMVWAALAGLVLLLALRVVLPARIWADLKDALDYLARFGGKTAVVILALVILAAIYHSVHG